MNPGCVHGIAIVNYISSLNKVCDYIQCFSASFSENLNGIVNKGVNFKKAHDNIFYII